jgi:hypothetical protein
MTATSDSKRPHGLRALLAGLFTLLLALAMTMPAIATEHWEEGENMTMGQLEHIDTDEQFVVINDEKWFYNRDDDAYYLFLSQEGWDIGDEGEGMSLDKWECVAEATADEGASNLTGVDYDPDEGSWFGIATAADIEHCDVEDDDNGDDDARTQEEEDDEEAQPVARAERVDTGAGGAATDGAGVLPLIMLGALAAAGATLRKAIAS